jgi:hypothetical protein
MVCALSAVAAASGLSPANPSTPMATAQSAAGAITVQAERPAARVTTSSEDRARRAKQAMLASITVKGRAVSAICGAVNAAMESSWASPASPSSLRRISSSSPTVRISA